MLLVGIIPSETPPWSCQSRSMLRVTTLQGMSSGRSRLPTHSLYGRRLLTGSNPRTGNSHRGTITPWNLLSGLKRDPFQVHVSDTEKAGLVGIEMILATIFQPIIFLTLRTMLCPCQGQQCNSLTCGCTLYLTFGHDELDDTRQFKLGPILLHGSRDNKINSPIKLLPRVHGK